MDTIRIGHILMPRRSVTRPVLEYAWAPIRALSGVPGFSCEPIVLLPYPDHLAGLGRTKWPPGLRDALSKLDPSPSYVLSPRVPRLSLEFSVGAICASILKRPRAERPHVLMGSILNESGFVAACAAKVLKIKSVVSAHGTDIRFADGELKQRGAQRRALLALRNADSVLAMSTGMCERIRKLGFEAIKLPFTVFSKDFPLFAQQSPNPSVLFVGRIEQAKGVETLARAFAAWDNPHAELVLVGAKAKNFNLDKLLDSLDITNRTNVFPDRPQWMLPTLYQQSSMVVLPSHNEGLGNVLVEALLCGRPVIGSDIPGIKDIVREPLGLRFPCRNHLALAQAMANVWDGLQADAYRPDELRRAGEQFAWETQVQTLAANIRILIKEN